MSYIGNTATTTNFTQGTDYFNGDGSTVAFTLSRPVVSINDIEAIVNNVPQDPSSAYTVSGSTITFTGAPSSGTNNIRVRYLSTIQLTNVPAAGSVTKAILDIGNIGSGTGAIMVPTGTTGQRPTSPVVGYIRYNTTLDCLENYNSTSGWTRVSAPIPTITSVTGTIYAGLVTTISISGSNFETTLGSVTFTSGAILKAVSVTPTNDTTISVAVPSEIYSAISGGDIVGVKYTNTDNGVSAVYNVTSVGAPSGGTITTYGSYRLHTFTSSGNFVVPTGFSKSADWILVAGGAAGGGRHGGGGGAGGLITSTTTLSAQTYSIVVGAGGSAVVEGLGTNGGNSTGFGYTATGGGGGGIYNSPGTPTGQAGGSGGGGGSTNAGTSNGGAGTPGQGNAGGSADYTGADDQRFTGGGGGAGAAGEYGKNSLGRSGNGGVGLQVNIDNNNYYWAGGGGGSFWSGSTEKPTGAGGSGGGGGGGFSWYSQTTCSLSTLGVGGGSARNAGTRGGGGTTTYPAQANGGAAGANTGGGGGGSGQANIYGYNNTSGAGGSGIFQVRYIP